MKKTIKTTLTGNEVNFIESELQYEFNNLNLLQQAFTEKSLGIEQKVPYNDVLKQVGDSVIKTLVMKMASEGLNFQMSDETIYNIFNDYNEVKEIISRMGFNSIEQFIEEQFTKRYASDDVLSKSIEEKTFENLILMSKGDAINNVNQQTNIKVNLFKSIIGAIAVDSEWNFDVIEEVFDNLLDQNTIMQYINPKLDEVTMFHKWYFKEFKEAPVYEFIEKENNNFECILKFNFNGKELVFKAEGSKKLAKQLCCKVVIKYLEKNNYLSKNNEIAKVIDKLNPDTAINKLQMLFQKGLIPEPVYEFNTSYDENGNPVWECALQLGIKIISTDQTFQFEIKKHSVKKEAKKDVAFFALINIQQFLEYNEEFEIYSL